MRVHAAAVNIGDWHLLRGVPYVMRTVVGLRTPKHEVPGIDVAGRVEAVGDGVKQLRPGDEVFGWCEGAFAEYACAGETTCCRSRPTSRSSRPRLSATPPSPPSMRFAIKGKFQPGQKC